MMQVSEPSLAVLCSTVYIVTTNITFIISTKMHRDLSYLVGAGVLVGCDEFYGLRGLVTGILTVGGDG